MRRPSTPFLELMIYISFNSLITQNSAKGCSTQSEEHLRHEENKLSKSLSRNVHDAKGLRVKGVGRGGTLMSGFSNCDSAGRPSLSENTQLISARLSTHIPAFTQPFQHSIPTSSTIPATAGTMAVIFARRDGIPAEPTPSPSNGGPDGSIIRVAVIACSCGVGGILLAGLARLMWLRRRRRQDAARASRTEGGQVQSAMLTMPGLDASSWMRVERGGASR
jgi:hypothetical protein